MPDEYSIVSTKHHHHENVKRKIARKTFLYENFCFHKKLIKNDRSLIPLTCNWKTFPVNSILISGYPFQYPITLKKYSARLNPSPLISSTYLFDSCNPLKNRKHNTKTQNFFVFFFILLQIKKSITSVESHLKVNRQCFMSPASVMPFFRSTILQYEWIGT